MRVISTTELSTLTRQQLFALLVQIEATLAGLEVRSPEHAFCEATLRNIRLVLAQKGPAP